MSKARTGSIKSEVKVETFAKCFQTQEMICDNKPKIKCQITSNGDDTKLAVAAIRGQEAKCPKCHQVDKFSAKVVKAKAKYTMIS